ncbi:hypothetical protein BH23CHL8_BH23CHL8_09030 [soil metagenome]
MPVGMESTQQGGNARQADALKESNVTFPADEVVWGVAVRPGFDELDDPFYHRGLTQHAFLEGHDNVALCGFRPPLSGPRHRRRPRLSLPSAGVNPMCGTCARRVVAPRARVSVPVQPERPAIAIPVAHGAPQRPMPVAAGVAPRAFAPGVGAATHGTSRPDPRPAAEHPPATRVGPPPSDKDAAPDAPPTSPVPQAPAMGGTPVSPWVHRAGNGQPGGDPKGGLLKRGIRPDLGD